MDLGGCRMLKKEKNRCFRMGLLLVFAAVLVIESYQVQARNTKFQIEAEIQTYQEKENEDGVIVETPNPYFVQKQVGYAYRSPDTITYHSDVTDSMRHAMVFLPADYREDKEYPVLYLLHGYGGSHRKPESNHRYHGGGGGNLASGTV